MCPLCIWQKLSDCQLCSTETANHSMCTLPVHSTTQFWLEAALGKMWRNVVFLQNSLFSWEILFFSKILCFCYTLYVYFSYTLYVYFCYTLYVCFCYTLYVVFVTLCMFVFCYTLYVCFCYTLYVCFCYTLYVYFCYTLYVYFCYTLYVCFCYTLYVRNSKSLKLEKFEVGKDRSSKRSTLQKFEVRNVLFLLALIWLIKFRLYNNMI